MSNLRFDDYFYRNNDLATPFVNRTTYSEYLQQHRPDVVTFQVERLSNGSASHRKK